MRIVGGLLVAATIALPSLAAAEVSDPLASAGALMEGQEYDHAQSALTEAIEAGGLDPEQLADAYRALAECYAALRRPDDAQAAFRAVLALDPSFYVASDQSPLVRQPFEAARRASREAERLSIAYDPPPSFGEGEPLVIEPEIVPGDVSGLAAEVVLHVRGAGGLFLTFVGVDGVVEVPAVELEGLEEAAFYLELRDEHGNSTLRVGSPTEPLVVPIGETGGERPPPDEHARPWYAEWWLWTAVGVVVVGLAVGLPLGLMGVGGDGPCERELGAPCDITASIQ
jgi:tetratricopeptide (TPR) repeat protein